MNSPTIASEQTRWWTYDLATRSVRELNLLLHREAPAGSSWRVSGSMGKHNLAVGLNLELTVEIDGHVGYYCAGMNQLAQVAVKRIADPEPRSKLQLLADTSADYESRLATRREWEPLSIAAHGAKS